MSNQQVLLDKWLDLLKQSKIIKLSDLFLGSKNGAERFATASSVQSTITCDISSLSSTDKSGIKQCLNDKNQEINSNVLSGLSKLGSNKEIPSFVYIVVGTVVGYLLMEVLNLPLIVISVAASILLSFVMYLVLENSKKRYYYNYLLKLLK